MNLYEQGLAQHSKRAGKHAGKMTNTKQTSVAMIEDRGSDLNKPSERAKGYVMCTAAGHLMLVRGGEVVSLF